MEEGRIKELFNGKKNVTCWIDFKILIISTV